MFEEMLQNSDIVVVDYFGEQKGIVIDGIVYYFEGSSGFDPVESLEKQYFKRVYRQNGKYGTNTDRLDLIYEKTDKVIEENQEDKLQSLIEKCDELLVEIHNIKSEFRNLS
jgi:mevalonate kinase